MDSEIEIPTYRLITTDCYKYQIIPIPPGLLQYKVQEDTICNFDIDSNKSTNFDYKNGFELECHTKENLLRLIPNTRTGRSNDWKIILVIKKIEGESIWLKGALRNLSTNEIALISSANEAARQAYKYRLINSHDAKYKIGQCKMIAPLFFWEEMKNRIEN